MAKSFSQESLATKFDYLTKNYFVTYGSSFIVLSSSHHSKLLAAKYIVQLTLQLVKDKVNCSYRHLVINEKTYHIAESEETLTSEYLG
jgi:hypothetical protein